MLEALRKWCDRNPLPSSDQPSGDQSLPLKTRDRLFNSRQQDWKPRACVYCDSNGHKSTECDKIVGWHRDGGSSARRRCVSTALEQGTGPLSVVSLGAVRSVDRARHHTSICDKESQQMLLTTGEGVVIYPVVVVIVDGIKCRALLDTAAGSLYSSAALVKPLGKQPSRTESFCFLSHRIHNG